MNEDFLDGLYKAYKLDQKGTFDEFKAEMSNKEIREGFFKAYKLDQKGTFDEFENEYLGEQAPVQEKPVSSQANDYFTNQTKQMNQPTPIGVLAPKEQPNEVVNTPVDATPIDTNAPVQTSPESTGSSKVVDYSLGKEIFAPIVFNKDDNPRDIGMATMPNLKERLDEGRKENFERTNFDIGKEAINKSSNLLNVNLQYLKHRAAAIKGEDIDKSTSFDDYVDDMSKLNTILDGNESKKYTDDQKRQLVLDFDKKWNSVHNDPEIKKLLYSTFEFASKFNDAEQELINETPNYQKYLSENAKIQQKEDDTNYANPLNYAKALENKLTRVVLGSVGEDMSAAAETYLGIGHKQREFFRQLQEKSPSASRFDRNMVEDYANDGEYDYVFGEDNDGNKSFQYVVDPKTGNKVNLILNETQQQFIKDNISDPKNLKDRRVWMSILSQGMDEAYQELPGIALSVASDGIMSGILKGAKAAQLAGDANKIQKGINYLTNLKGGGKKIKNVASAVTEFASGSVEGTAQTRDQAYQMGLRGAEITAWVAAQQAATGIADAINPMEIAWKDNPINIHFKKKAAEYAAGKISKTDLLKETGAGLFWDITKNQGKETFSEAIVEPIVQNIGSDVTDKITGAETSSSRNKINARSVETAFWGSLMASGTFGVASGLRIRKDPLMQGAINYAIKNPEAFKGFYDGLSAGGPENLKRAEFFKQTIEQAKEAKLSENDQAIAAALIFDRQSASLEAEKLSEKYGPAAPLVVAKQKEVGELSKKIADLFDKETSAVEIATADAAPDNGATGAATSKKVFTDFDNTLFDPKTGQLTDLGIEMKDRIANGEDVDILTAREDTPENRKLIADKLGIDPAKIQMGLSPEGKAAAISAHKGEKVFYDDNKDNIAAAKGTGAEVIETGKGEATTTLEDKKAEIEKRRKQDLSANDKLTELSQGNIGGATELAAEINAKYDEELKNLETPKPTEKEAVDGQTKPVSLPAQKEDSPSGTPEPKPEPKEEKAPDQEQKAKIHKENIVKKFSEEFGSKGIPKKQIDAAIGLMEARAKSWASEKPGRNADEWYDRIADVKSGEFEKVVKPTEEEKQAVPDLGEKIDPAPKPKSDATLSLEKDLEAAQKEVKSAKDKLKSKREKLTKTAQEDAADLFGGRKSNDQNKLIDERAAGDIEKLLDQEKRDVSAAETKADKLKNKLEESKNREDPTLFDKPKDKISDIDKEIDDIWEHFNKLGISTTPEQQAKDFELGIRLATLYIQKGVYKLADIVKAGIEKLGEAKMQNILPFIKNGYLAYQGNATDEEIDKMDDLKTVRNFKIEEVKKEPLPQKNKEDDKNGGPKLGGRKLDSVGQGQQKDLFSDLEEKQPTGNDSDQKADGVRKKPGGVQEVKGSSTGGSGGTSTRNFVQLGTPQENFTLDENSLPDTFTPNRRFNDNIDALKTLLTLLKEKRYATKEEQEVLSKYVGWGGLKVVLNDLNTSWNDSDEKLRPQVEALHQIIKELEKEGLKKLLPAIKASTQNAYYTEIGIIKAIYTGIEQLGFKGGHVLDPSAGIGHFTGAMPLSIRDNSKITQVELDPLTGEILKHLYPKSTTHIKGLQESNLPNNYYDLIISNVPFGSYGVFDPLFKSPILKQFTSRIHAYFFAKAIQQAKEGGLIAFVTSAGLMDSTGNKSLRQYIKDNAEFLGAIRLPESAFKGNANTQVVTDIILLRKTSTPQTETEFLNNQGLDVEHKNTGDTKRISINEYFMNNPDNVIGEFKAGGLYTDNEMTVIAPNNINIQKEIEKIIKNSFPINIVSNQQISPKEQEQEEQTGLFEKAKISEIYLDEDGKYYVKQDEYGTKTPIAKTHSVKKVKDLLLLRDALQNQYEIEAEGVAGDEKVEESRKQLNTAYNNFVTKYGKLNKRDNKSLINKDINSFNILSLEKNDGKADIFNKRVINPRISISSVDNIDDAIIVSENEYGRVNIDRIASLLGQDPNEVVENNYGALFYDTHGTPVSRDEYLSGNVKKKLAEAIELAKKNDLYKRNVAALTEVIPEDVFASAIEVNLGARWVPTKIYEEFINHIFNTRSSVIYSNSTDAFAINANKTVEVTNKYAVKNKDGDVLKDGLDLLDDAMHNKTTVLRKKVSSKPDRYEVMLDETATAKEKQDEIKELFKDWIWKSEKRREDLGRIYNDLYNTDVKRKHDGSKLTFEGLNNIILAPHQKDAIAMLIHNLGGIVDHIVGSGKTFVMIAGAIKMKQMGLVNKPVITGLKSTIPALRWDAKKAYPGAKILVPTESDFSAKNRKKFLSKIQNNDWDLIIMSHEQFSSIPHDTEIQIEIINDELAMLEEEIINTKADGKEASKQALKGLETRKQNLMKKLGELMDIPKDKEILNFKQIGIDHVMVDESQMFKNLEYSTRINKIAGLGNRNGSKRAFNMLTTARTLQKMNNGDKGITFSSGTPISNSLVEMYLLFKYLRPNKMIELGYKTFDAWVAQFAEATTEVEFSVGDIKQNQRYRRFINLPELSMMYNEIADVRNDNNLKLPKPKITGYKNDKGELVREPELIAVKQSDYQLEWTKRIIDFTNQKHGQRDGSLIGKGELSKKEQNAAMLMATTIGNKLSIDMRLIDKNAEDNPTGKLAAIANNAAKIYKDTMSTKGTQLIFSDIGTPKTANTVENLKGYLEDELNISPDEIESIFGEEGKRLPTIKVARQKIMEILEISEQEVDDIIHESKQSEGQFNVYSEVKKKLIDNGVPAEQIVFIHDYKTGAQKDVLFGKVNSGEIRIVLGSTQKLGTGVNAQKKITALHHIDASWNPAAMEQRNGRGIRQGNENEEVAIYYYGTERTLDAYKYQLIATKQRFIDQIKSGALGGERSAMMGDGEDLGAQARVAILSGNPLLMELAKIDDKVQRLVRSRRSFDGEQQATETTRNKLRANIPNIENEIKQRENDFNAVVKYGREENGRIKTIPEISSSIKIENTKDLGQAIIEKKNEILKKPLGHTGFIGKINGLELYGTSVSTENVSTGIFNDVEVKLHLKGEYQYPVTSSADPTGQGVSIGHALNRMEENLSNRKEDLVKSKANLIKFDDFLKAVWPKQDELNESLAKQKEINAQLQAQMKKPDQSNNAEAEGKVRENNILYDAHDDQVFISLVKGTDTSNNTDVYLARINKQLAPQAYQNDVKPEIEKLGGEWNRATKNIIFRNRENAIKFKDFIEDNFGVSNKSDVKFQKTDEDITLPDNRQVTVKPIQADVVNGFYSPLEKTINEFKGDRLPAKQWAEKFKGEEAKWTGLTDWLSKQQGSVSKAEIQQFLKDNRIQVVEVVKGEVSNFTKDDIADVKTNQHGAGNWVVKTKEDGTVEFPLDKADDKAEAIEYALEQLNYDNKSKRESKPKFQQYQLEGEKENYREVLVTMPNDTKGYYALRKEFSDYSANKVPRKSGEDIVAYQDRYKKELENDKDYQALRQRMIDADKKQKEDFKSSHFDEPNILVHLRMSDRIDSEGNKVLHLSEIQSDWGQKGKKEGFNIPAKKNEFRKEKQSDGSWVVKDANNTAWWHGSTEERADAVINEYNTRETRIPKEVGAIPNAPFVTDTNQWVKLGLKTALKYAVKSGATKITWETGETQNARYDLSKQVDEISTKKYPDGTYTIIGYKDGNSVLEHNDVPENKLEEYVGKDLAKKISDKHNEEVSFRKGAIKEFQDFQNELQDSYGKAEVRTLESYLRHPNNENSAESKKYFTLMTEAKKEYEGVNKNDVWNSFSGVDLKVGGKGMKGFYGSPTDGSLGIVGNVAKSLFKQEPKTVVIETVEGDGNGMYTGEANYVGGVGVYNDRGDMIAEFDTKAEADKYIEDKSNSTQHSITITPELKASAEAGQPLFQKDAEGNPKGAVETLNDGRKVIVAYPGADFSTMVHELAHIFEGDLTEAERKTMTDIGGSEAFAESFETYIYTGEAPTPKLKALFNKFKQWMADIYRSIKGSPIENKIRPDVKQIFDRLLTEAGDKTSKVKVTPKPKPTPVEELPLPPNIKEVPEKAIDQSPVIYVKGHRWFSKKSGTAYEEKTTPIEQKTPTFEEVKVAPKEVKTKTLRKGTRKVNRKIKNKEYQQALSHVIDSAEDLVIKGFIEGAKLRTEALKIFFKGSMKEVNARIGLINNETGYKTITALAHDLHEDQSVEFTYQKFDDLQIRNAIETVITEHNSVGKMVKTINAKYAEKRDNIDPNEEQVDKKPAEQPKVKWEDLPPGKEKYNALTQEEKDSGDYDENGLITRFQKTVSDPYTSESLAEQQHKKKCK